MEIILRPVIAYAQMDEYTDYLSLSHCYNSLNCILGKGISDLALAKNIHLLSDLEEHESELRELSNTSLDGFVEKLMRITDNYVKNLRA